MYNDKFINRNVYNDDIIKVISGTLQWQPYLTNRAQKVS